MKQAIEKKLHLNAKLTLDVLTAFVREEVTKAGFSRIVMGLSGGIDSALVAYLAVHALGQENVQVVMMPYKTSSANSLKDAEEVCTDLNLKPLVVPISAPVDAFFQNMDSIFGEPASNLRRGNRMARERMCTLFDISAIQNALVLGTSNKTELLLGYGTQFGDLASAINPIGDLYKIQVRQLSKAIGVPNSILEKAPSADLWENQTDEQELGFDYDTADEILYQLVDARINPDELATFGYDSKLLGLIVRRMRLNQYKRKPPVIAKISSRTVGIDFRYLRDWGN
ncbi:NAD+ synthase [Alicyclobacillus ferrooxydans]|uniref:NH(3)-dependent NAD(+) synthetase n=1 Tax=Alicyclobacillus ferrooxydans TaxID=471514 RepID=A0A0P9CRU4_9BACL|nr:NAD+ synthase [Alicyclobacillus ferrooxydans]KPV42264.1 NAD synthetase [Alicyclobacillus ferrooxydans]